MTEARAAYLAYKLKRAREALKEAAVMWEMGHFNTYINRLYYACFYAVSALLFSEGLSAARHAGIRTQFAQYFVKTARIAPEFAELYFDLFQCRLKSDYADQYQTDPQVTEAWLALSTAFIDEVDSLIQGQTLLNLDGD